MKRMTFTPMLIFLFAVPAVTFAGDLTVDEVLEKMSEKAGTIRDIQATAKVTKFDSLMEERRELRLELAYKKPHLAKVDTHKKIDGKERHTQQVIIGEDFITRVWPDQKHGERRHYSKEQMTRRRQDRNDPLTFFTRKPEELKKDFRVEKLGDFEKDRVVLGITPKDDSVPFDYTCIELTVDTTTWLPAKIKAMAGGKDDDWSMYEFRKVRVNRDLKDSVFKPARGVKVVDVKKDGKK